MPINAVFFFFFKDGASEFLARSWLIEPNEVEARSSRAITQKASDPWNGRDFVVNFGDGPERPGRQTEIWLRLRRPRPLV